MLFAIKRMREYVGMTQQDVADALGIKKSRYGDWERETREINLRDAVRLARLFGCSLDELAGEGESLVADVLSPDQVDLLRTYSELSPSGRKVAVDVAHVLRGCDRLRNVS